MVRHRDADDRVAPFAHQPREPGALGTEDDTDRLGHNVLAGMTYVLIIIAAVFQLISGFYLLFPEVPIWEQYGVLIFGSQQSARYIHHLLMWLFMIFAFIHIYLVIWNDIRDPEGLVSAIFTGVKFQHKA